MVRGLWGKKIGMTQLFSEKGVVPVTVIDVAHWFVVGLKTVERDGYSAVKIGRVKERYAATPFSLEWVKKPHYYFTFIKEVQLAPDAPAMAVGSPADFHTALVVGEKVDVSGRSIGRGFCGVVKRHNFRGPPASHGSTMGKRPGGMSFMRSRGRVIKGKRLPGHYGNEQHMIKNLEVMNIESDAKIVLVKGSVPGKSGSLVFVRKA